MAFCLSSLAVAEFKKRLISGETTPEKLNEMTSEQRREYFSSFLGEAAGEKVNAAYESKLLLKNQKQGIITWANKFAKEQPKLHKDILSKVEKMSTLLDAKSEDSFYADLVKQKLGFGVSMEEAGNLHSLNKRAVELRDKVMKDQSREGFSHSNETVEELATRMEYGVASGEFTKYYEQLKGANEKIDLKNPGDWWEVIKQAPGFAKAMKASLDISIILRQGLKVAFSHPGLWAKHSVNAFKDFANTLAGHEVLPIVMADAVSRQNFLNGKYKEIGLDLAVREEAYPTSVGELVQKIPLAGEFFKYLGRGFKASEVAFRAFQIRTRVDLADHLIKIAEKTNGDLRGIGEVVNSLTGRGHLGRIGENSKEVLNNLFFSPRLVRSNIDALTAHGLSRGLSSTARKEAVFNTLKIIGGIAGILTVAKMIAPDSVEEDPTSSDFGKIKVGDTRFDVSGGMSGLVTLAMRIKEGSVKSSVTGVKEKLGSGQFETSYADLFMNFAGNKLSPAAAVIKDVLTQKDFEGKKPTFAGEAANLLAPLPITTYVELKHHPDSANIIAAMILESLGVSTNTYSYHTDWSESEGKEIMEFHQKIGDEKFKTANQKFNDNMNNWLDSIGKNASFQKLNEEDKKKIILNKKIEFKKKIFVENGFYPKKQKENLPKF